MAPFKQIKTKWQIVCGSYNELMVLRRSIKMEQATMCDVGERFWEVLSPQMLLTKFGANKSNGRGGVGKRTFIIFSQSLSGSWGSSHLSFMSFRHCGDIQHFVFWTMKLLFNNLSIVWNFKILLIFFARRVHRCCVQSLVQMGEITWEEYVCDISWICEKKNKKKKQ